MARKKNFKFAEGIYYFNVYSGPNTAITIKRKSKEEAIRSYTGYLNTRKQTEWLGKWNGKKFVETEFNKLGSKSAGKSAN